METKQQKLVIDLLDEEIIGIHLNCASREYPITITDPYFGIPFVHLLDEHLRFDPTYQVFHFDLELCSVIQIPG